MSCSIYTCRNTLLAKALTFDMDTYNRLREDPEVLRVVSVVLIYMCLFLVFVQFVPKFLSVVGLLSHIALVVLAAVLYNV